ncbi:MAG: tetratricopeptide repeat protein [Pseudomonadota bacterium]
MTPAIENFEKMLAAGRDDALLRFSLGNAWLGAGEAAKAVPHLQKAVEHDPKYSAAWKLLGRALNEAGDAAAALDAYRKGIEIAKAKGDIQAAREMTVFARRIEKNLGL